MIRTWDFCWLLNNFILLTNPERVFIIASCNFVYEKDFISFGDRGCICF